MYPQIPLALESHHPWTRNEEATMNQEDRADRAAREKRTARRRIIAKVGLNIFGLIGLVGGVGWGIVGTIATAIAAFSAGLLTLGLGVWPVGILGLLVSWGPVFLLSALARGIDPIIRDWANKEQESPESIKLREYLKARRAREYPALNRLNRLNRS